VNHGQVEGKGTLLKRGVEVKEEKKRNDCRENIHDLTGKKERPSSGGGKTPHTEGKTDFTRLRQAKLRKKKIYLGGPIFGLGPHGKGSLKPLKSRGERGGKPILKKGARLQGWWGKSFVFQIH